jgi:hypothetical protein
MDRLAVRHTIQAGHATGALVPRRHPPAAPLQVARAHTAQPQITGPAPQAGTRPGTCDAH